jgi:cephalosporin hydroxylase
MNQDDPQRRFEDEVRRNVAALRADTGLRALSSQWLHQTLPHRYSYNFRWLGRPIIQYPQDIVATTELIWAIRPDVVVETGIAHGGSLVLSASMLALLDYQDAVAAGTTLDPARPARTVVGIDIEIRPHNRTALESHPMASRIRLIEGSSIAPDTIGAVRAAVAPGARVLVLLDSNHTEAHVLAELEAYAPLVTAGSYCVVFDTVIEHFPEGAFPDRPWDKGDNPMTAVRRFVAEHPEFVVDEDIDARLLISVAPGGFLKRIR